MIIALKCVVWFFLDSQFLTVSVLEEDCLLTKSLFPGEISINSAWKIPQAPSSPNLSSEDTHSLAMIFSMLQVSVRTWERIKHIILCYCNDGFQPRLYWEATHTLSGILSKIHHISINLDKISSVNHMSQNVSYSKSHRLKFRFEPDPILAEREVRERWEQG